MTEHRLTDTPKQARSMGSHQSARAQTVEWLTPPSIIESLGDFDLDPCCPPNMPWTTAETMLTKAQDGLSVSWDGRVWLNPPFGRAAVKWLRKLAAHGDGIALIPARTETAMFYECVWGVAEGVLFLQGRPHFHVGNPEGATFKRKGGKDIFVPFAGRAPCNSGAPIALVAYGRESYNALITSELGAVVKMAPFVKVIRTLSDIVIREAA